MSDKRSNAIVFGGRRGRSGAAATGQHAGDKCDEISSFAHNRLGRKNLGFLARLLN
jgi:hypothetical protein